MQPSVDISLTGIAFDKGLCVCVSSRGMIYDGG